VKVPSALKVTTMYGTPPMVCWTVVPPVDVQDAGAAPLAGVPGSVPSATTPMSAIPVPATHRVRVRTAEPPVRGAAFTSEPFVRMPWES